MTRARSVLLAVASLAFGNAGCIAKGANECAGGIVCPADKACVMGGGCASPEQIAACDGLADAESCTFGREVGKCINGVCIGSLCGNGEHDPGEICDDGNLVSGDGCRSDCLKPEVCGDGVIDSGEDCDGGAANADVPDAPCRTSCQLPHCGDGILDSGERCEVGSLSGRTCLDFGFYEPDGLGCSSLCSYATSACDQTCGDGVLNGPELCDVAPAPGESCVDYGFDDGRLACSSCAPSFTDCARRGWLPMLGSPKKMIKVWASGPNDVFGLVDPVGYGAGIIAHYNGDTWSSLGIGPNLFDLHGSGPNDVWAIGISAGTSVLWHYDGSTWSQVPASDFTLPCQSLNVVWANAPNDVFALCGAAGVHFDGTRWSPIPDANFGSPIGARDAWSSGPNDLYVAEYAGLGSTFLAHFDGTSWTRPCTWIPTLSLWGRGPNDVFAGSLHYDGVSCTSTGTSDEYVWGVGPRDVFLSGYLGTLKHYDGIMWTPMPWPNAGRIKDLSGDRYGNVYAAGNDGAYWWPGAGMFSQNLPSTLAIRGVWGRNADEMYVAASDGIYRYDGTRWSLDYQARYMDQPSKPPYVMHGAWGTGTDIYVPGCVWDPNTGGGGCRLFHLAGSTWTYEDLSFYVLPTTVSISGTGPNDIYVTAVTENYPDPGEYFVELLHYDGSYWASSLYEDTPWGPGDVLTTGATAWWKAGNEIFAVGAGGTIRHYDGSAWTQMASGTSVALDAVWGTGPTDVFAAGEASTLLHYDGVNWSAVRSRDVTALRGLWAAPGATVVVGDHGSIQRLVRTATKTENSCSDVWDNDEDGKLNCADPDCAGDATCTSGGLCPAAVDIACGASASGNNLLHAPHIDNYACSPRPENGREVFYRFKPAATSTVTATLYGTTADLDLAVLGTTGTAACDPHDACVGASSTTAATEQVSFTASAGRTYYLVVDGYQDATSPFTLQVSCP